MADAKQRKGGRSVRLVLLRHGESTWNQENRFTGWIDVDLSERGIEEAQRAGTLLRDAGFVFDEAHTSVLKRAINTLLLAQEELDLLWIPVEHSWRLNERHYGALQGLNKAQTAAKYGEEKVHAWRRSYDVPPPPLAKSSPMWPGKDPRYAGLKTTQIPAAECLKDTEARVMPYWKKNIVPRLRKGRRILIVAHGNSLRALVKHLDGCSGEEIAGVNIPTGFPLVYEFDKKLKVTKKFYLGDKKEIARAINAVANQAKKK